jgi:solute carrier family 25 oxoglutarate transporter 11
MRPAELYTGLSAGLLRQAVYTTARLGFFDTFMGKLSAGKAQVGFSERAIAGLSAGGLGEYGLSEEWKMDETDIALRTLSAAMLGNPADLALIRMQSDGLKPAHMRANYSNVFHALTDITAKEGLLSLWTGAGPTIARAMALNFGQLAFFSETKSRLGQLERQGMHSLSANQQTLASSAVAGFFASFFSLPFDFVKTRMQKGGNIVDGKRVGMVGTALKVAREEGVGRFYRGFGTYYVRIAPHAMVTLLVADYLGWLTK